MWNSTLNTCRVGVSKLSLLVITTVVRPSLAAYSCVLVLYSEAVHGTCWPSNCFISAGAWGILENLWNQE